MLSSHLLCPFQCEVKIIQPSLQDCQMLELTFLTFLYFLPLQIKLFSGYFVIEVLSSLFCIVVKVDTVQFVQKLLITSSNGDSELVQGCVKRQGGGSNLRT